MSNPGKVSAKRDAVEFPREELRLPLARLMRLAEPALEPRLPGVVALGLLSLLEQKQQKIVFIMSSGAR